MHLGPDESVAVAATITVSPASNRAIVQECGVGYISGGNCPDTGEWSSVWPGYLNGAEAICERSIATLAPVVLAPRPERIVGAAYCHTLILPHGNQLSIGQTGSIEL